MSEYREYRYQPPKKRFHAHFVREHERLVWNADPLYGWGDGDINSDFIQFINAPEHPFFTDDDWRAMIELGWHALKSNDAK